MKKRVAIDAGALLPTTTNAPETGIRRVTRDFLRALEQRELPFEVWLFGQKLRRPYLREMGFCFSTRQLYLPRWGAFDWWRERLPIVEWMCRYDLFHALGNYAAIRRPEKAIVTIYDAIFLASPEPTLCHAVEAARIPPLARRCRAIVTPSQASKADIVNYIGVPEERVHVIPLGVRHDLFRPVEDAALLPTVLKRRFGLSTSYFIQVSCSLGRKNSRLLLEGFSQLAEREPDVDLVFVWRNPPREMLELCEKRGLSSRVHFVQEVNDEDLRLLYCGATALVFPSSYEGFGLPVLEAMACGTPVITTRLSSLPEVGGNAALYIDSPDKEALTAAMLRLLDSESARARLRRLGMEQAARFRWDRHIDEVLSLYNECLDCSRDR